MTRLNRGAAEVLSTLGVRGCTDITGFGMLGHGAEMALASGCGIRLRAEAVPLLPGAMGYAEDGHFAGGMGRNRTFVESLSRDGKLTLRLPPTLSKPLVELLFDSETSGGLLFSAPADQAPGVQDRFAARGEPVWEIGEVIPEPAVEVV
jgi:selenide,water dikinase